jgi:phosphoglycolate phosphatase
MNIQAVVFDLDGTLIDSFQGIEFSVRKAIESVIPGRPIPDDLRCRIGLVVREVFQRCFEDLSSEKLDEMVRYFRTFYDTDGCYKVSIYPGVKQVLEKFDREHIPCFIVTNKPILPTRKILHHLEITEYFTGLFSRDNINPPYSSKSQMMTALLEENCFKPAQVVLVGDTIEDAQVAATSGTRFAAAIYGYGFNNGSSHIDVPVRYRLNSISELCAVLNPEPGEVIN